MRIDSNNCIIPDDNHPALKEISQIKGSFSALSVIFFICGIALMGWAFSSDSFWNTEKNFLNAGFCLPFAIGFGLILMGFLNGTKWKYFAFWTALALTGQAATLQMIDAGQLIHFQHYRSLPELLNGNSISVVLFAVQIILVSIAFRKRLPVIINWLGQTFTRRQIAFIALFLTFAGAAVTPNFSVYLTSLSTAFLVQTINLANIILIAWAVPVDSLGWLQQKFENIFGESIKDLKPGLDRFSLISALWVVLIAALLSYFVYQAHPHVPDETQYLFQAKYMAAGQLTVKPPTVPEAFSMYMVPYRDDRWYGIFPPAYPAMLAVGIKLNAVWLVNPILAGLCVLLTYLFFQEIYSRRFARIGVILLCCSPWFIFMAMSFMSHIFMLFCALSAAVLLTRAFRSQRMIFAFGAGLAIGIVSLIRPLDGLIIAGLFGIWTLLNFRTRTMKLLSTATLAVGTICSGALVFLYNKSVTGVSTLLPMDAYYTKYFWKDVMALGFGTNRGMDWGLDAFPGHSPLEAVINTALNTFLLNTEFLGWATGSLILALCFVVSGKLCKKDIWALAVIITVIGSYSFYWYSGGPDFGARYWFLIIIPLIVLSVRGIEFLSLKIQNSDKLETRLNPQIVLAVLLLCTMTLINYLPWRAFDKYHHYLKMQPDIKQLAKQNNFGKSIVLIRGMEHPDYQSAWIYNPLNFEGDAPIYAWDKTPEIRTQILNAYFDRQVWIIDGPTLTGRGYQIIRGPVKASQLLAEEIQ